MKLTGNNYKGFTQNYTWWRSDTLLIQSVHVIDSVQDFWFFYYNNPKESLSECNCSHTISFPWKIVPSGHIIHYTLQKAETWGVHTVLWCQKLENVCDRKKEHCLFMVLPLFKILTQNKMIRGNESIPFHKVSYYWENNSWRLQMLLLWW